MPEEVVLYLGDTISGLYDRTVILSVSSHER
jgi:hypothetical protein